MQRLEEGVVSAYAEEKPGHVVSWVLGGVRMRHNTPGRENMDLPGEMVCEGD